MSAAAIAGLVAGGCSETPDSSERLGESIVVTKYDPNAKFGDYGTFYIRPTIRLLADDAGREEEPEYVDDRYAEALVETTAEELTDRGYERVEGVEQADGTEVPPPGVELGVELVYLRSVTTSVSCYSWWDPYYWGYPAWGYYPYYGTCSASTWRSGTLVTNMIDLVEAGQDPDSGLGAGGAGGAGGDLGTKLVTSVWFSAVYGIEYDYTADNVARGLEGITQAFDQSPYLGAE